MMLGGSPAQGVWTITSTSEMSGRASSGIWRKAQIPASTSSRVPVKTRKRFRAHQSIHRAITSHPSCGIHAQLLTGDGLTVLFCEDCDLPGSAASQLARPLIESVALVVERDRRPHSRHAHCRHCRHEERHADFCPGNRRTVRIGEFHPKEIAALVWRGWI